MRPHSALTTVGRKPLSYVADVFRSLKAATGWAFEVDEQQLVKDRFRRREGSVGVGPAAGDYFLDVRLVPHHSYLRFIRSGV